MRDLLIFLLIMGSLPFCFVRPYIGILMFSCISYMNPHRLTWGSAHDFSFALFVAVTTLAGFAFLGIKNGKWPKMVFARETILLLLLWFMFIITTIVSLRPDWAWPKLDETSKILLMTFLTIPLIDDENKLRKLLFVIALSLGFYGFKGGLFAILTGGRYMVLGPEGSFIEDNTALGLALNMALPMLFYLAKSEKRVWIKNFLLLTFFLTILSVLFTYSRGALLGLLAVLGLIVLRSTIKIKLSATALAILILPIAFTFVPDKWIEKMERVKTYEEDGSAMGRIGAWQTAWLIAINRPLTGGGFQVIDDDEIARSYNPRFTEANVGVHSIYFEVMAENGFITFAIYLSLLFSAFASTRKVRNVSRLHNLEKPYYYSLMIETSIVAFAISGAFLEFASFDLYFHLIAILVVLKAIVKRQVSLPEQKTARADLTSNGSFIT